MWVMKLRIPTGVQFLGNMAVKHQVSMTGYPLSYYKNKKWLYLNASGFLFGKEKNKNSIIRDLPKQKECIKLERNEDFFMILIRQPLFTEPFYDPKLFRPKPVIINKEGYHIWDLASFDRKPLEKILKRAEKKLDAKVLKFKQEKITNISFTKILPDLTKNQKRALELAIHHGYYEYPKEVNLETLAKKMKISYSTFQAHLKKAEGKIIPSVHREL